MFFNFSVTLIYLLITKLTTVFSIDIYSDNIYHSINWPGPLNSEDLLNRDKIVITTNSNEKYQCLLPTSDKDGYQTSKQAISPAKLELELLKPIFDITLCTYRLETYWTYQLCHGKHIRQYHEENKDNLQEYFLGRYTNEMFKNDLAKAKSERENGYERMKLYEKVQNLDMPFFELMYDDGTVCDVTNTPRRSRVKYVCHEEGKGEIYDLKEVASCEYDIIVLTNLLCRHPKYGPKKELVHTVDCHPLEGTSQKPKNLLEFESPVYKNRFNYNQYVDDKEENSVNKNIWDAVQRILKEQMGSDTILFKEGEEMEEDPTTDNAESARTPPSDLPNNNPVLVTPSSRQIVRDFLEGTYCIDGGVGWWKHEFCYGKHIVQYHQEGDIKSKITLGVWDKLSHLVFLENNPNKRPKPLADRKYITQYYANGQICEETGLSRNVEVRIKCADASPGSSISLYLLEPIICEYRLVVESAMFCDILSLADLNGLFPVEIKV